MSGLTVETLEKMFLYLGCANVSTQSAMDGAIPMTSLIGTGNKIVAQFDPALMDAMPPNWSTKTIWFQGDTLGLSTVRNVHWSVVQPVLSRHLEDFKRQGIVGNKVLTAHTHGYVEVFYSEINKFGSFIKFPIKKRRMENFSVSKIFNPSWLLSFEGEHVHILQSPNDSLYKEKRLPFLSPLLCGLAQTVRTYWKVCVKLDDICPSLTLLTDPTGVKEFWKLRDVPVGKKRRDALLHWVNDHWRKTRTDPDVETYVRKHMRGSEEISQGQFRAKIIASETDSLDAELAKQERESMRKNKTDRRNRNKALQRKKSQKTLVSGAGSAKKVEKW